MTARVIGIECDGGIYNRTGKIRVLPDGIADSPGHMTLLEVNTMELTISAN